MSSETGNKTQPWKAALAEQDPARAANDTPKETPGDGRAGATELGPDVFGCTGSKSLRLQLSEKSATDDGPEIFKCTGSKVQTLEKLIFDTQRELEGETSERGPQIMKCTGSKVQTLEKLIFDTQKQLEDIVKGEYGATEDGPEIFKCTGSKVQTLEKLIFDTQKELGS
ncbi:Fc.00g108480.m01.CDS01 [Cosmosporella sp. VM-42]